MAFDSESSRTITGIGRLRNLVFRRIGGHWMRSHRRVASVLLAATATLPLLLVGASAQPAAAAPAPITIAFVTDLTGPGASQNATAPAGFKARIALQNSQGGVNGHKIVPLVIDDQTSPTLVVTAVQNAISKGAFGIVSESPLFFEAAKYPQQAGIPVTGAYNDGPEWGEQPYTNMFASDLGSVDPKYPVNTMIASFLRTHGGTVIGTYGYSISPSSSRSAIGVSQAFTHLGGKVGVLDTSVPFGGVDFTTAALTAKQKGVNSVVPSLDNNSNFALATALHQAGVKLKSVVYATGFEPDVINSPAWKDVQGAYFLSFFRPFSLPNAGTVQMASALQKYAGFSKSEFPTYSQYESWMGADLMIKGMQLAGKNPTRAAVIKKLRGITSYTGNGLLAKPINFTTIFGHDPAQTCAWFMQANKTGFVPVSSQPFCGKDLPGTATATAGS